MTLRRARPVATLETERVLWREHSCVVGMDEVGRGAVAGPVSVGAVLLTPGCDEPPPGLTDSKLVPPAEREALVPLVRGWCLAATVGHASAREIDEVGIVAALRLAGRRALADIATQQDRHVLRRPVVLLDGSQDWLSTPEPDLWVVTDERLTDGGLPVPPVMTRVKADVTCASVAAASIVAKCERDAMLVELDRAHPGYGWAQNKGYGTAAHRSALVRRGTTTQHRTSWNLTGP